MTSTWTTLWKFRTPLDPDHGGATSTATLWRDNLGGLVLGMDYADGERVIVLPLSDEDMDDLAAAIHEHRTKQANDSLPERADTDPTPCPTCNLPTWDGIHQSGRRLCYMDEVPR